MSLTTKILAGVIAVLLFACYMLIAKVGYYRTKADNIEAQLVLIKTTQEAALKHQQREAELQRGRESELQAKLTSTIATYKNQLSDYQTNLAKNLANKDAEIAKLKSRALDSTKDLESLREALNVAKTEIEKQTLQAEILKREKELRDNTIRQEGLACLTTPIPTEYVQELNKLLEK